MAAVYVLKIRRNGAWHTEAICGNRKDAMACLKRYRKGHVGLLNDDQWTIVKL